MKIKKKTIQNTYSDALYWAVSKQSKDKDYHITRGHKDVLLKLIHYSHSNPKITYSNKIIGQHIYCGEETIKKATQVLTKIGFISTGYTKISHAGQTKTRRTIYIQWDFIEAVLSDVPAKEEQPQLNVEDVTSQEVAVMDASEIPEEFEAISTQVENEVLEEPVSTQTIDLEQLDFNSSNSTHPISDVQVTDEKLNWLNRKFEDSNITRDDLKLLEQSQLHELFYGSTGIWKINDTSMENQYQIKYVHRGGCKSSLYNKNQSNDHIEVSEKDFAYTLEQIGIDFGQVTPELYHNIKSTGLLKKPVQV